MHTWTAVLNLKCSIFSIVDVNTFHSLWNNSLTAISQSRMIPSPSSVVTVTPTAAATPSPTYSSPSPFLHTPFPTFPFSYPTLPPSFLPIVSPMTTLFPLNPMFTQIRPITPTVLSSAANFPITPVTQTQFMLLSQQTTPTSSSHPQFISTTSDPKTISSSLDLKESEIESKEAAGPSSGPLRAESPVLWENINKSILSNYESAIVQVETDGKAVDTVKATTRPITTLSFKESSSESGRNVPSTPLPQVRPVLQQAQLTGLPMPRSSRPTSLPTLLPMRQYSPHPLSLPALSTLSSLTMFPSPLSLVPLPVTSLLSTVQTTPPTLSQTSPMLSRQHLDILATTDCSSPSSSSITRKHKSTFDSSSSSKRPAVILRSHSSPSLPTTDNADETQVEASTQNYMSQTPLEGFGNLEQSGKLWMHG